MNFPLISEYIKAIMSAEDNFEELKNLRPVLNEDGQPFMSSGNFAVVFKMKDVQSEKLYAAKCFLKEQDKRDESYKLITEELNNVDSPYLTSVRYYEKELFVDSNTTQETEFPVLLMDWVEGTTLDKYLQDNIQDQYALEMLAYRFSQLALWLLPQPFAHGDLKPDNILVRDDGKLVLVDYDGMYVPAMKGQKARELGSPDFRHPQRTEDDFDEHIDDFPIISILLSLKAISIDTSLLEKHGATDRLLFSFNDYCNLSDSLVMKALICLTKYTDFTKICSLFLLAISLGNLRNVSFHLIRLSKAKKKLSNNHLMSLVTKANIIEGKKDEYGVIYSKDGERLLQFGNLNLEQYTIKQGTKVICDEAFYCSSIRTITIPQSVKIIGNKSFMGCSSIQNIFIPYGVSSIGNDAFSFCETLKTITISNSVTTIGKTAFAGCKSLIDVKIPKSVKSIGVGAFSSCNSLKSVNIPDSVISIGSYAFSFCKSLQSIKLSNSISSINEGTFASCRVLYSINIPDSVTSIGNCAFQGCISLKTINIPDQITNIGKKVFDNCLALDLIIVSNGCKEKIRALIDQELWNKTEDMLFFSRNNEEKTAIDFI